MVSLSPACISSKFLVPISGSEYQPENGPAGNWMPPTSKSLAETPGRANHCIPRSSIAGILKKKSPRWEPINTILS